jgi:hypothetical protein
MHDASGDIVGLASRERFPFSAVLPRDHGSLDHRPLFVAWMPMSAGADARKPLSGYKCKDFVWDARHRRLRDQHVDFNLLRKRRCRSKKQSDGTHGSETSHHRLPILAGSR